MKILAMCEEYFLMSNPEVLYIRGLQDDKQ